MSCTIDDVFHFHGEPQRCLYCLEPLVAVLTTGRSVRCRGCGLSYALEVLRDAGTDYILADPDRFHIERFDSLPGWPGVPGVLISDLDAARSVLDTRGDQ